MTAPESSPKPAEAIAPGFSPWTKESAEACLITTDGNGKENKRRALRFLIKQATEAAIQRGDGQCSLPVVAGVQTSTPAHSLDQNFMLVHGTPPAAKPNETSGATLHSLLIKHLGNSRTLDLVACHAVNGTDVPAKVAEKFLEELNTITLGADGPTPDHPADTPRTNEAIQAFIENRATHCDTWRLARQLERELTEAQKEIEAFKANNRYMRGHTAGFEEGYDKARNEINAILAENSEALSTAKNLHRLICEASGYVHDETDWRRDMASLAEHVRQISNAGCGDAKKTLEFIFENGGYVAVRRTKDPLFTTCDSVEELEKALTFTLRPKRGTEGGVS